MIQVDEIASHANDQEETSDLEQIDVQETKKMEKKGSKLDNPWWEFKKHWTVKIANSNKENQRD